MSAVNHALDKSFRIAAILPYFSEPRAVMERRRYDAGREKSYPDLVKAFFHRQKVRTLVRNDIDEQAKLIS